VKGATNVLPLFVPSIVPESESLHVIMREGPLCFIVFGLSYRKIVDQEESFLRNTFGEEFGRYCAVVPRWLPRLKNAIRALTFGSNFHLREFGTTFGIIVGGLFFEWIESPVHRFWIMSSISGWPASSMSQPFSDQSGRRAILTFETIRFLAPYAPFTGLIKRNIRGRKSHFTS
jgi:hypothetical protein